MLTAINSLNSINKFIFVMVIDLWKALISHQYSSNKYTDIDELEAKSSLRS
jgi:hypothetical protein